MLPDEHANIERGLTASVFVLFSHSSIESRFTGDWLLEHFSAGRNAVGAIWLKSIFIAMPMSADDYSSDNLLALMFMNIDLFAVGAGIGPVFPFIIAGSSELPRVAPILGWLVGQILGLQCRPNRHTMPQTS